ncbi:MAG: 3'-5' exoribonuclease YhaM family protein [Rubripirellula sp.]
MSSDRVSVKDLCDGVPVDQAFRVADKQLRVNRQGSKYILLRLEDKTGIIAAMMWNVDERVFESFDRLDFVVCRGRTQIHNGSLQMIVTAVERIDPSRVDLADFERFDSQKANQLFGQLSSMLKGVKDPALQAIGEAFLADSDFVQALQRAPAAVSHHHAFPGGLLQHTVDLMELVKIVATRYPQLDGDLLLYGAFLHDLGKIKELSSSGETTYTDQGQLVGHIVIGVQMLSEKICDVSQRHPKLVEDSLRHQLEHLIVSHHGSMEYGSPRLPATLEALVLHHLDNLDAKLASYINVIDTDISVDGNWTNYNSGIGRKLWRG